jgi:signal transduction histidine kinase
LQALNQALEDRVLERTRDLELANAELKDAMLVLQRTQNELVQGEKLASLGRMVAGVAHELNTPIGNALTIGSTLADHARRMNRAMQDDQLKRSELAAFLHESAEGALVLERALRQASHLIASFKQVAADQQSEQRRPFDLKTTIDEILAILRPGLRGSGIVLESSVPPGIAMDSYPGLLAQVLSNLVTNAKVHAFEGRTQGRVHVEAHALGDLVALSIRDDGNGIAPDIRSRIFDPFFTTRMGRGGTGLGLSIVHGIVTQGLGGSIRVDYSAAQGTCFVVTVPQCDPRPPRHGDLTAVPTA